MIVPVTNVTGNDETVSDYKLYEYKGSDDSNKVCFFIRITRLVTKCFCPNPPYLSHNSTINVFRQQSFYLRYVMM